MLSYLLEPFVAERRAPKRDFVRRRPTVLPVPMLNVLLADHEFAFLHDFATEGNGRFLILEDEEGWSLDAVALLLVAVQHDFVVPEHADGVLHAVDGGITQVLALRPGCRVVGQRASDGEQNRKHRKWVAKDLAEHGYPPFVPVARFATCEGIYNELKDYSSSKIISEIV